MSILNPTLALGLASTDDYCTARPFLDLMKFSRPMWAMYAGNEWGQNHAALVATGVLDADGWPTALPATSTGIRTIWAPVDGTPGSEGPFVMTWEGSGTIALGATTTQSSAAYRRVFTNPGGGQFWLDITATDPGTTGDYIRNIRIVPAEYEALADAGEIFNPDWLEIVQDARQLRFMDWMKTNASDQSAWADRPQVDDVTYDKSGGPPVEIMVALANKLGVDPWFTMPHLATDEYIEEFATIVHATLAPELRAHVEYSNETWNFAFGQYTWLAAQANSVWGVAPGGTGWIQYCAKRATETALLWNGVYGYTGKGNARLYHVMGVQQSWQALAEVQLNAAMWEDEEPGNFVDPATVFDAIGITTYLGSSHVSHTTPRTELLAEIAANPGNDEAVWDWLLSRNLTRADIYGTAPYLAGVYAAFRTLADTKGMDLVGYEGGSHEWHSFASGISAPDLAILQPVLIGYSYSDQIVEFHEAVWDAWALYGDGPFMQYYDVAPAGASGAFGAYRYLGDVNPRATYLAERNGNAADATAFGLTGGTHYLPQKVAQFESGGSIEFNVRGGLAIGGGGQDIAVLAGAREDYTITRDEDDNYVYTGADGTVTLMGAFNVVRFAT